MELNDWVANEPVQGRRGTRVLQFVQGFPPEDIGGTEFYCASLSLALRRRGHECLVISGTRERSQEPRLFLSWYEELPVLRAGHPSFRSDHWTEFYAPEIEELIKSALSTFAPTIVHVHHWQRLTSGITSLCVENQIPVVVTLHDLWASCPRVHRLRPGEVFCEDPVMIAPCLTCVPRDAWQDDREVANALALRQQEVARELQLADHLLVPSRSHRAFLAKTLGLPEERFEVLPLGSPHVIQPAAGEKTQRDPTAPIRLASWGPMRAEKGAHILLAAIRSLPDPSRVDAHLFGGYFTEEYRKLLEGLATGLQVTLHGAYRPEDLGRLDVDVAVIPSLCAESYSFVLDEAMQLGVPVIVSDRGALVARAGSGGLSFESGNAKDLARQIQSVIEDPDRLPRMAAAGPASLPVEMVDHAAQMEEIYQKVLARPRTKQAMADGGSKLLRDKHYQVRRRDEVLQVAVRRIAELETEMGLRRPPAPAVPAVPRVSVVVPVYNGAKTVAEALQSVLEQTYKDYEIIVINDASKDRSLEVLEGFRDRIQLISLKQNGGQSAVRNLGASLARGEYLAFLDQDDVWYPYKLERQLAVLDGSPEVGLVYSDLDEIDIEGRYKVLEVHKSHGLGHPKPSLVHVLVGDLFILPSTVVCRKRWFEKVGGFDERLIGYEDDDLWIRMWPLCRFAYIPLALTKWRIHRTSSSETPSMETSREIFFKKLTAAYGDDSFMLSVVKRRFYNVYRSRGTQLLRRGERGQARRHYWNALRNRPYDFMMLCRLACTVLPVSMFRFVDSVRQKLKR